MSLNNSDYEEEEEEEEESENFTVAIWIETNLKGYPAHKSDFEEIKYHLEKDIELKADEYGRVWNCENGEYIADIKFYPADFHSE